MKAQILNWTVMEHLFEWKQVSAMLKHCAGSSSDLRSRSRSLVGTPATSRRRASVHCRYTSGTTNNLLTSREDKDDLERSLSVSQLFGDQDRKSRSYRGSPSRSSYCSSSSSSSPAISLAERFKKKSLMQRANSEPRWGVASQCTHVAWPLAWTFESNQLPLFCWCLLNQLLAGVKKYFKN